MQEQPRVLSSPQYLQPVEQKDYQYIPTHQTYFNQPAPANGTLSVIFLSNYELSPLKVGLGV